MELFYEPLKKGRSISHHKSALKKKGVKYFNFSNSQIITIIIVYRIHDIDLVLS